MGRCHRGRWRCGLGGSPNQDGAVRCVLCGQRRVPDYGRQAERTPSQRTAAGDGRAVGPGRGRPRVRIAVVFGAAFLLGFLGAYVVASLFL